MHLLHCWKDKLINKNIYMSSSTLCPQSKGLPVTPSTSPTGSASSLGCWSEAVASSLLLPPPFDASTAAAGAPLPAATEAKQAGRRCRCRLRHALCCWLAARLLPLQPCGPPSRRLGAWSASILNSSWSCRGSTSGAAGVMVAGGLISCPRGSKPLR